MFCNIVSFDCEEFLASHPTPKLLVHPLSAVRDCLFNIFIATIQIGRSYRYRQPEDAPCCGNRDPLYRAICRSPSFSTSYRNVRSARTYEVTWTVSLHPM
jgi:hypothetical protein